MIQNDSPYDSPKTRNFHPSTETFRPSGKSGLSISGFITAVVGFALVFGLIFYAGYLELTNPGGVDEESTEAIIAGLMIIFGGIVMLVSMGLCIAALVSKAGTKGLAIAGTIINGAAILFIGLIVLLGG